MREHRREGAFYSREPASRTEESSSSSSSAVAAALAGVGP